MPSVLTGASIAAALGRIGSGERQELVDALEPGLRLRMTSGKPQWSLLVRLPSGDRIRVPLGPWPAVGVPEARAGARSVREEIEAGGEPEGRALTVNQLLELYAQRRLAQLRTGASARASLDILFRQLGEREVAGIGRRDLATALDEVALTAPIHANRMLAYAKAMFSWAVGRGLLDVNPIVGLAKPNREISRDHTPSLQELARIWIAAEAVGYPFGHAVRLLILTAARRSEVARLSSGEIEGFAEEELCWVLPASRSKNGRSLRSPLSVQALAIINDAAARRPGGAALLFTTNGRTPISGWSKAKAALDLRTRRVAPWRLHDLRRSFATLACDVLHIDAAVADRCLNHVGASTSSTVARVYARGELFDQRRDALTKWADLVERAVAAERTQAVTPAHEPFQPLEPE